MVVAKHGRQLVVVVSILSTLLTWRSSRRDTPHLAAVTALPERPLACTPCCQCRCQLPTVYKKPAPQAAQKSSRRPVRREATVRLLSAGLLGCLCASCAAVNRAEAMASIVAVPEQDVRTYDLPRNKDLDAGFAQGMAYGMVDYERTVSKKKRALFETLFQRLPRSESVVVEVGMGSFPNALYFGKCKSAPNGMDIIGVDPNDSMTSYAKDSAERAGLMKSDRGNTLRITHGVSEALPLDTGVADAVICTLTLCSVIDPRKSVSEMRRILKPGGQLLFLEHVLSETDPEFAKAQVRATPAQVKRADGCHFDRRTLETIRAGGFNSVQSDYFELNKFGYLNPTVAGIAVA